MLGMNKLYIKVVENKGLLVSDKFREKYINQRRNRR